MADTPRLTFAACFPAPVAVPDLGLSLGPATLCHLAALDMLDCPLLAGHFGPAAVMIGCHVLSQPSADIAAALQSPQGVSALRQSAAAFALQVPLSALNPLRDALVQCINQAFETAVKPANPTAGAQPAPPSAGP